MLRSKQDPNLPRPALPAEHPEVAPQHPSRWGVIGQRHNQIARIFRQEGALFPALTQRRNDTNPLHSNGCENSGSVANRSLSPRSVSPNGRSRTSSSPSIGTRIFLSCEGLDESSVDAAQLGAVFRCETQPKSHHELQQSTVRFRPASRITLRSAMVRAASHRCCHRCCHR
jgi:hypothetical protein